MLLPQSFITHLNALLNGTVEAVQTVSGGSINHVYRIDLAAKSYLLKLNDAGLYPDMFQHEAEALRLIAGTGTISTPDVIYTGVFERHSFLILSWIKKCSSTTKAMTNLATQLAAMHRNTDEYFGLDENNYMGSLRQSNRRYSTWRDFFIHERLMPMVQMAAGKQLLSMADRNNFEKLYSRIPELFDEERPSLIHGDLWSGNYLIGEDDRPYLIDPALAYGHREFDIAMTTLFGGFSEQFYDAYDQAFPLAQGWQERLDLWNLYPLLVHLNLFGTGYLHQLRENLSRYI